MPWITLAYGNPAMFDAMATPRSCSGRKATWAVETSIEPPWETILVPRKPSVTLQPYPYPFLP